MNKIYKKWWFWIIIIVLLIISKTFFLKNTETTIDSSKLEEELKHNLTAVDLDYIEAEQTEDTTLELTIAYKNDILNEGTVNSILKLTEKVFSNFTKINLKIIQEEPFDFIKYTYDNKKWTRES